MRSLLITALVLVPLAARAQDVGSYLREIKPLLQHKCYVCHGAIQQRSKLRVDTVASLKQGGESGPAVVPGQPEQSVLMQVLTGKAGFRMPPEGEGTPLTSDELAKVARWIAEGATAPANDQPQVDPRQYWSYRVPTRPALPSTKNAGWIKTPIDAFIAAEHEKQDLQPRPTAPPEAWLRRVYVDLIGLPPTRAELHAFLADTSPRAAERVVDQLLSGPQYGERWGRHWMDIWRYSDWYGSRGGNEIRYSQRHIWRWRDWIVESLNADVGYDRMVLQMLAADELAPNDPAALPATGFIGRNWYKFDRNVWMFETVERTAEAFLALTLRCARCHDHKYDPIAQKDYYRFRAFFEPHNVRHDPLSALTETEKDATLGQVLKDGIPRVFDKELDAPTYRFIRGDDRTPDKSEPLSPGVPASLGGIPLEIQQVTLPLTGYYPILRPGVRETLAQKSDQEVAKANDLLHQAEMKLEESKQRLDAFTPANAGSSQNRAEVFHDAFAESNSEAWQILDGQWVYENGHVTQKSTGSFSTMVLKRQHPENFRVRLKYRTLAEGSIRSVGFSFDFQDKGNSQDVYTATGDARQTVQAFHRVGGQQSYPQAGIREASLKVGEVTLLEVLIEGQKLTIDLNGERKLDYVLPVPRKAGRFALWTHAGTAEFLEVTIEELLPTHEQLANNVRTAEYQRDLARLAVEVAKTERASVVARIAAELAKYGNANADETKSLAVAASQAERRVASVQAQRKILDAEFALAAFGATGSLAVQTAATAQNTATQAATGREAALKRLSEAKAEFEKTQQAIEQANGTYQPVGDVYPATSTGRRLALARWIAHEQNPRTARVAVNHIWGRHFGQPLVASTENFGMNGAQPSHPELLDWLATELVRNQWRMKPLHKQIVLSSTYALASSEGDANRNRELDPTNRFLWHANSRRMEAEVVRDSVLHLAGTLDLSRGGPEIPESKGQEVFRRSMYFRNTPNEKMPFLEAFDVADPNACYRRKESVVPQQALAMMNSALAQDHARSMAESLQRELGFNDAPDFHRRFITAAFEHLLTRSPSSVEIDRCLRFLLGQQQLLASGSKTAYAEISGTRRLAATDPERRVRENLIQVLLLHNDFVTIR